MSPAAERTIGQIAHALTPWEWTGRTLAVVIVALVLFAGLTVVQRALVADSALAWAITGLHATVAAVIVPVLSIRAVRRWRSERADQLPTGVPE